MSSGVSNTIASTHGMNRPIKTMNPNLIDANLESSGITAADSRCAVSQVCCYSSDQSLSRAIRRVSARNTFLPPEVSKVMHERSRDELSAREREVLILMAEGMSNRAIAEELASPKRRQMPCGHDSVAFGVEDRTQAVLQAIRRGYVRL